jgi:hypothetical protein
MPPLRQRRVVAAALFVASAAIAATVPRFEDYAVELLPSVRALLGGDVGAFLSQAPVYGGSVAARAPALVVAHLLGAGDLGVYRAGVLVCALGVAALAWYLDGVLARAGRSHGARLAFAATCLGAPVLLGAYTAGHPEDPLAGALSVAAILLAARARPGWAGLALGAAIATKPWAVIVAPLALAAAGPRPRLVAGAAAGAGLLLAPFLVADLGHAATTAGGASGSGWIFHPWQVWWPLRTEHPLPGGFVTYTGPDWVARLAHPIVVAASLPPAAAWALCRRRAPVAAHNALGVLALVLLLRCLLDPWNGPYYAVPFVLALAAWEAVRGRGLPVLAIAAAVLTWLTTVRVPQLVGWDLQAAAYLAWSVPLAGVLAARLLLGLQPASAATAARTAAGSTGTPKRTRPGASTSTKPTGAAPARFLSRPAASKTSSGSTPSSRIGSPAASSRPATRARRSG